MKDQVGYPDYIYNMTRFRNKYEKVRVLFNRFHGKVIIISLHNWITRGGNILLNSLIFTEWATVNLRFKKIINGWESNSTSPSVVFCLVEFCGSFPKANYSFRRRVCVEMGVVEISSWELFSHL